MKKVKLLFLAPTDMFGELHKTPIDERINKALIELNLVVENLVNIQIHQESINNQGSVLIFFSASIIYIENVTTEN
jgi:hypothetical protein